MVSLPYPTPTPVRPEPDLPVLPRPSPRLTLSTQLQRGLSQTRCLVGRRYEAVAALRRGFQGTGDTPHPILAALRTFSFSERRRVVSGTEILDGAAVAEIMTLKQVNKQRERGFANKGISITQNYEWLLEILTSAEFQRRLHEFLR